MSPRKKPSKAESISPVYSAKQVTGDEFEPENHFYERVLNATVHPLVQSFLNLGNKSIVSRYCHLNPQVNEKDLLDVLSKTPKYFRWSGADLFKVSSRTGRQEMIVIETNSCPSGMKSLPGQGEDVSKGYHRLMMDTFLPWIKELEGAGSLPQGGLAVMYDKNDMENTGYAMALSEVSGEPVWLVEFYQHDPNPPVKWVEKVMHVRDEKGAWHPIRASFRYVTQKPWNRIPLDSKTLVFNSVVCCLAGGRNKMMADKAYELLNVDMRCKNINLEIRCPETKRDITKEQIPLWVKSMGGVAVIKNPYSNAGQGVWIVTNNKELETVLEQPYPYDKYIVQSLVGNAQWSSVTKRGQYYHTGLMPTKKGNIYVADLRMMIRSTPKGYEPISIYARKARIPLSKTIDENTDSWAMLGTNLSVKKGNAFTTDTNRLMLMDTKDFNKLGLGIDDLIDAYVQTVLSSTAIDSMADMLTPGGSFNRDLFSSLNEDDELLDEIIGMGKGSEEAQ